MKFRPNNLLDFLVWVKKEVDAERYAIQTLFVVGEAGVRYMEYVDKLEEQELNKNV